MQQMSGLDSWVISLIVWGIKRLKIELRKFQWMSNLPIWQTSVMTLSKGWTNWAINMKITSSLWISSVLTFNSQINSTWKFLLQNCCIRLWMKIWGERRNSLSRKSPAQQGRWAILKAKPQNFLESWEIILKTGKGAGSEPGTEKL